MRIAISRTLRLTLYDTAIHSNRGEQQSQCAQCSGQGDHDARGRSPDFEIVFELDHVDGDVMVKRSRRIAKRLCDIREYVGLLVAFEDPACLHR